MKFGPHMRSLHKSLSARLSVKRRIKNALAPRAPLGLGWLTHTKKAAYNRVYNCTSFSIWRLVAKILK